MAIQEGIPSVLEGDATGETADIYGDIRQVLGGSIVNLVWRNLATIPGALRWTWSTVRPLYVGPAPMHAEALRRAMPLPDLPRFTPAMLANAGLSADDLARIGGVLDSYQHTNALALVVLSALLAHYDPRTAALVKPADMASLPPVLTMPRLPTMAELPPEHAQLVRDLNSFGEDTEPLLIASMYRHLTHWPAYLLEVRTLLAPLAADGRLLGLVQSTRALGRAHGQALAPLLTPAVPPDSLPEALAACRLFAEHPIARMTCLCALIRRATV